MKISTQKQKTGHNAVFGKIGIFSASLLAASSAVYLYSPVIGTHADTSMEVDINANVNPVASLNLDINELNFNITPTASGAFQSKPVVATVSTNSTGGYELYFSSVDNSTDMVNASVSDVVASDFSGTVTSSTMAANKWGYSLNDTDFSAIPSLSSQATLKNLDHYPSQAERTTTMNIGIKIDDSLPSGLYSKSVIFSVLAHETPAPASQDTISDIDDMQDITADICTRSAEGETNVLTDSRDGSDYTVFRGNDGRCWMSQNLRLINETIHKEDSDFTSKDSFTVPDSANWRNISSDVEYIDANTYNTGREDYGVYYNFAAATAGEITGSKNQVESTESICPKGWKIPSQAEWQALFAAHNITENQAGANIAKSEPLNFVYSGNININSSNPTSQGSSGSWWSTTASSDTDRWSTYATSSSAGTSNSNTRRRGYSIRCVTRQ